MEPWPDYLLLPFFKRQSVSWFVSQNLLIKSNFVLQCSSKKYSTYLLKSIFLAMCQLRWPRMPPSIQRSHWGTNLRKCIIARCYSSEKDKGLSEQWNVINKYLYPNFQCINALIYQLNLSLVQMSVNWTWTKLMPWQTYMCPLLSSRSRQ